MPTTQRSTAVPRRSMLHHLTCWTICCVTVVCMGCAQEGNKKSTHTTDADEGARQESVAGTQTDTNTGTETDTNTDTETDTNTETAADPDRILRHAVFFSFKDSSTDEQIKEVVDAFRALPAKIDSIVDFQWGTNNSPEGLNDGFTHCFLLSFKDGAGRDLYLPHEAHAKFGDVLRPHMDKVFVVDYWGTKPKVQLEKQLKHMVFFKFKDDAPEEDVKAVVDGFAALPSKIDTIKTFEWGTNNSPEKKNDGFTHAFAVTFDSEDGRAAYLPHPDHDAFAKSLGPVIDKVRVLDFWAEK